MDSIKLGGKKSTKNAGCFKRGELPHYLFANAMSPWYTHNYVGVITGIFNTNRQHKCIRGQVFYNKKHVLFLGLQRNLEILLNFHKGS